MIAPTRSLSSLASALTWRMLCDASARAVVAALFRRASRAARRGEAPVACGERYGQAMLFVVRDAQGDDMPFIIEMAREASTIEDRSLPNADSAVVSAALPRCAQAAVIGESPDQARLGAAWWHWHEPPLACDSGGRPLPEMVLAVRAEQRGRGVGTALIEALAVRAAGQFSSIVLNVHIRNPAAWLYSRTGFIVMGKGRGPLGVAMQRDLPTPQPPG